MKSNDWKDRLNVVYSTNPDFRYETGNEAEETTLPKEKQQLRISLDRRNRGGKTVTIITGFTGTDNDLQALERLLKVKCGVGGASKNREIIIQGDFRKRISELLLREGYAKSRIV
ncbi:MAG: translation initiation factor [Dysgonamonadaceae bacterium]|nr:translation initiation factor [Dysgonamonadaceae bacterium]